MSDLGIVSEIRPRGRSARLLQVKVGEAVVLEADREIVAQFGLRPGGTLTERLVEQVQQAQAALQAGHKALRLLEHRPRSRGELARALRRGGCDEQTVERTLQRLEQAGLVDDQAFAAELAQSLAARGLGRYAIAQRLHRAGLRAEQAEAAVALVSQEPEERARARQTAERYASRLREDDPRARQKLYQHLMRKGFDTDTCRETVERQLPETS